MNDFSNLIEYVTEIRLRNPAIKIVATNGCFDVIHRGHVSMLKTAKSFGDILIVGLNSDSSVRALKGESRPINSEDDRKIVLEELRCVDFVSIFRETTSHKFLDAVSPDVYVKAGDYTWETLNPIEKDALVKHGTEVKFVPFVLGLSTTNILRKI